MKRMHQTVALAVGALTLVAASATWACGPGGGWGGNMGNMGNMGGSSPCMMQGQPGDAAAMSQRHLERMKTWLKITPAQEGAWKTYADAVAKDAAVRDANWQSHSQALAAQATAPERMDAQIGFMKQRAAQMETLQGAFKDFYAALTPEQRSLLDQPGGRMGGRRGMMRGGR